MLGEAVTLSEFSEWLESEVQKSRLSYSEYAKHIGVATTTITRAADKRKPKTPGFDFLYKLAKATGKSFLALVELAYPEVVEETKLSPSAQLLAQEIETLPEDKRAIFEAMVRGLK